jgi:hypothetical protein
MAASRSKASRAARPALLWLLFVLGWMNPAVQAQHGRFGPSWFGGESSRR